MHFSMKNLHGHEIINKKMYDMLISVIRTFCSRLPSRPTVNSWNYFVFLLGNGKFWQFVKWHSTVNFIICLFRLYLHIYACFLHKLIPSFMQTLKYFIALQKNHSKSKFWELSYLTTNPISTGVITQIWRCMHIECRTCQTLKIINLSSCNCMFKLPHVYISA